jgi:hypothetical protein
MDCMTKDTFKAVDLFIQMRRAIPDSPLADALADKFARLTDRLDPIERAELAGWIDKFESKQS